MAIPTMNVEPARVIAVLKARLVDSITNASLLEAALEESLEREKNLKTELTEAKLELEAGAGKPMTARKPHAH